MTGTAPSTRGVAWWLAWAIVVALLLGGVYFALHHVNDIPPALVARA
ncbi:MAG: hypothetical protein IPK85_16090 [Gemmatimonadetes bacterium]|nr:hypothetical protein [Gemmatimonadota bacterium]